MSTLGAREPVCTAHEGSIELMIRSRRKDLGGFCVRRVLPAPARRTVGPFIFFDEMGPADLPPGEGVNVRPHPHIGLSTVTFLFEGEMLHRDSLGVVQQIQPGEVNLMTAGRGIVHSERTPPERVRSGQLLHGIQTWMALPDSQEEVEPAFVHYPAPQLPRVEEDGVVTTVIIGSALGRHSPVAVPAETLYLAQQLDAGATCQVPGASMERAVYVLSGTLELGDREIDPGAMAVLQPGAVTMRARSAARVVVIGGAPAGPRHIWWNFVHSSPERIEQAARDWQRGAFARVPGDDEHIPLPER